MALDGQEMSNYLVTHTGGQIIFKIIARAQKQGKSTDIKKKSYHGGFHLTKRNLFFGFRFRDLIYGWASLDFSTDRITKDVEGNTGCRSGLILPPLRFYLLNFYRENCDTFMTLLQRCKQLFQCGRALSMHLHGNRAPIWSIAFSADPNQLSRSQCDSERVDKQIANVSRNKICSACLGLERQTVRQADISPSNQLPSYF